MGYYSYTCPHCARTTTSYTSIFANTLQIGARAVINDEWKPMLPKLPLIFLTESGCSNNCGFRHVVVIGTDMIVVGFYKMRRIAQPEGLFLEYMVERSQFNKYLKHEIDEDVTIPIKTALALNKLMLREIITKQKKVKGGISELL